MRERREYTRLTTNSIPVRHRIGSALLGASSSSEDISAGGVSFSTVQKMDPGMVLNLDLHIPGASRSVSVQGVVVWQTENDSLNSSRFTVGARFSRIGDTDRRVIINYIRAVFRKKFYSREHIDN